MASDHDVIEAMAGRLASDRIEMGESSAYYDASHRLKAIGLSTPPEMRALTAAIGWPRLYLDAIEERLDIEGFRLAEDSEGLEDLTQWWQDNDLDEESGLGHLEAMIHSRAYNTVSHPGEEADYPLIRVESPLNMFADTDPRTRLVTRAVRIYGEGEDAKATLYLPDATRFYGKHQGQWVSDGKPIEHNMGVVPVVPIVNRERLSDRDGKSEITPELRSFTDAASRAFMNMQAAAELMAVPQRVLFGISADSIAPNGTRAEILDAYMARILTFEDEAGKAFQFSAAELRNFVDMLTELAKHVAAYTGLPPQYLSFASDNPASAEAIKSSESRLVKKCERKARMFGGSWERTMRLAHRVMTGKWDDNLRRLETVWRDPSTPTFASKADAVTKLYNSGQGIIPLERARIDMGYSIEERRQMRDWDAEDRQNQGTGLLTALMGDRERPNPAPAEDEPELPDVA